MRPADPLVSVVCPMYREEATIEQFHGRLVDALAKVEPPVRYQVVYVDDGSDDRSADKIEHLCHQDERIQLVKLARNFGHQLAITAGLDHATGDATVIIDTDLQDPPELIGDLIAQWREGSDVVDAERIRRHGESRALLFMVRRFYRLVQRLSETPMPENVGDFRLIDRVVREVFVSMREENRYIRGMFPWIGFSRGSISYERDVRFAGRSNYRLGRRFRLALDAVTSFSERPLTLAAAFGAFVTLLALALAIWIVVSKVLDPDRVLAGYGSLMVVVLFLGGVQLLSLGLIGSYLGRVYRESKARPLYVVRSRTNIERELPKEPTR